MTTTSLNDLRQTLREHGANDAHATQILRRWVQARAQDSGPRRNENHLPLRVRDMLPGFMQTLEGLVRLQSAEVGEDGAERLLLALHDGQTVEAVLLPKSGLCVSTQVGCAVGCTFCKTGEGGLLRQLSSAEIAAQLALARTRREVRKVVFMGMGEPAHNLDAVLEAIDLMGNEGGIGHKQLVLSTVGDRRVFDQLMARCGAHAPIGSVRPALALSLHSTDDARRARLLPRAPRVPVAEMVDAAERYARTVGYPIQYQWTLLAGVNDGDDEIEGIVALLRGRHAILNMIPWNTVDGYDHRRPDPARVTTIFHALNRRGVLTRMRQSAGQDVEAGCGQLRARAVVRAPAMQPVHVVRAAQPP